MRLWLVLLAIVVAFGAGVIAYDVRNPRVAEASGVGGGGRVNLSAYSGNVGISGNLGVTGTLGVTGAVTFQNSVTGVTGAWGISGNLGVTGIVGITASTGVALVVTGDTTSPGRGSVRLTPQNANPSLACALGDVFVFDGTVPVLRACFATTPLWEDVASVRTTQNATAFATGGQASATTICSTSGLVVVGTVASAGDSVKLPATPAAGKMCEIFNGGANSMNLFPGSGDVLCVAGGACLSANTATAVAANAAISCWANGTAEWRCR